VTRLLIARHGNTFAPGDIVRRVGITDLPLVESGLLQGQRLGAYLRQHALIPDMIFTSQLKRAIQTAEHVQHALASTIAMKTLDIFNEIDYGIDENLPEAQVIARIGSTALQDWETHAKVPLGWNVDPQQIIQNWQRFSHDLLDNYSEKTILVVTSNGIARFAPYLTGDFQAFAKQHSIKIATGGLCVFEKNPAHDAWRCLQWNIKPS
jgi:2,3-bisphosphoglycerate-dependent phosphoglycerate mutase